MNNLRYSVLKFEGEYKETIKELILTFRRFFKYQIKHEGILDSQPTYVRLDFKKKEICFTDIPF